MAVPYIIKSFIKDITKQQTDKIITTLTSERITLNAMADYIYSLIEEDKYSVDGLINHMTTRYPSVDPNLITKDIMATLEALWNKSVIAFKDGESPFCEQYKIKVNETDYIKRAVQEDCNLLVHLEHLQEIYMSPLYARETLLSDSVAGLLIHNKSMEAYIYFSNGVATDFIILTHKVKTDIISIAATDTNDLDHLKKLFQYVLTIYKKQPIFISAISNYDQSIYHELGFREVGTLRKEVAHGDVTVLMKDA